MTTSRTLKFFHSPNSRSMSIHWLLEELGVPYETELVDIRGEGGAPEAYRAIQPHKKVPAITLDGVTVTERAAISIFLTERFPEARLAPLAGDPLRGSFLSWIVYVDSVLDPALTARILGFRYENRATSYGSFDDMLAHVERALSRSPYVLGDTFSAADTQLGTALFWGMDIAKAIPESNVVREYLRRVTARPAFQRQASKKF